MDANGEVTEMEGARRSEARMDERMSDHGPPGKPVGATATTTPAIATTTFKNESMEMRRSTSASWGRVRRAASSRRGSPRRDSASS